MTNTTILYNIEVYLLKLGNICLKSKKNIDIYLFY